MEYVKRIIKIALVFLMIMCMGLSIGYANKSGEGNNIANIYLDSYEITASQVNDMISNEQDEDIPVNFTGWKQIDNVSISYEELERTTLANILELSGETSLVVKGLILFPEDKEGCLIDKKTAYSLFGSYNAVEKEIVVNERKLKVRGIHDGTKNTVIMQSNYNSKDVLDGILVNVGGNGSSYLKKFITKTGLPDNYIYNSTYNSCADFFTMIVPLIIFLIILFLVIKNIIKNNKKPVIKIIYILIGIILVFIFIKIIKLNISIPYDIIPNKWSDFNHWSDLYNKYVENLKHILYMKKYNIDIYYIEYMGKSIFYSILSVVIFLGLRKHIKFKNFKEFAIYLFIVIIIEFIVILKINLKYELTIDSILIYLVYPYYLINYYGLRILIKYKEINL